MIETNLYHYYPVRESDKLDEIDPGETIDTLFEKKNLVNIKRGELLYPYRDLYDLRYLLVLKKLWLNKYQDQNDPFELDGYYERSFLANEAYEFYKTTDHYKKVPLTKEEWNKQFPTEELIKWDYYFPESPFYHGMYSFSLSNSSTLMWSYYSTGHQGVCVRFKVSEDLNEIIDANSRTIKLVNYNKQTHRKDAKLIFGKVDYPPIDNNRPLIINKDSYLYYKTYYEKLVNKVSTANPDSYFSNRKNFTEYDFLSLLFILNKANDWIHEKEFRLFLLSENVKECWNGGIPLTEIISLDTKKPFFEIDAIFFGFKTVQNLKRIIMNSFGNNIH